MKNNWGFCALGAWLKLFSDGTKEWGSDEGIDRGLASWSKGRLNEIEEVRLFHAQYVCRLSVSDTSWHQFDRFIVPIAEGTQKPYRTHRAIQAEVRTHHLGQYLMCSHSGSYYFWAIVGEEQEDCFFSKQITKHHVDRWITVVLPRGGLPFMNFSAKGKINDHQPISK
jgi:hypothetical protein